MCEDRESSEEETEVKMEDVHEEKLPSNYIQTKQIIKAEQETPSPMQSAI